MTNLCWEFMRAQSDCLALAGFEAYGRQEILHGQQIAGNHVGPVYRLRTQLD